ncbi:MAG: hypothetical protein AAFP20_04240 [Cyanobacteria bacterium J06614_10]
MKITKLSTRPIMAIWRRSLAKLLDFYSRKRGSLVGFLPKLFLFFMLLNMACYWLAILTAYPQEAFGNEQWEYFLMQFPVGFLGALFDSVSFFITVWIARRALKTTSLPSYIAHLSIDILIAIVATFWVLMVFSVSGWLVGMLQSSSQSLAESSAKYESRLTDAVNDPLGKQNIKNIYFGVMMGFSAMIPTMVHLYLSAQSVFLYLRKVSQRRFQKL